VEYDYVIVGAGSAGCVLAHRLTEDPLRDAGVSVLLLEAGGPDDVDEIRIPAAFSKLFRTPFDWDYSTIEQKQLNGRRLYWPRGKTLGGSSALNAMIYIRGNPADYDSWRDEYGCRGWGYDDLLPYFRKAEDFTGGESEYHGVGGPLRVEKLRYRHALTKGFVAAARESGLPVNDDFNGPAQDGVGFYHVTQRRGRRWSTADAYLRHRRPSERALTVVTDALATRVLVDGGRATGVEYRRAGQTVVARAAREVILCGGAVNSPQLLMLSGIGPGPQLRELGIPVVADSRRVGAGLQDHPAVPLIYFVDGAGTVDAAETPARLLEWFAARRGPLTSNVAESGGFIRTRDDLPAPDVQYHVAATAYLNHGLTEPIGAGLTIGPTLIAVTSRGSLRLRSADPTWRPEIDPAYLTEESELDALVAGLALGREIASHRPLARYLRSEELPGPHVSGTDALRDYVRASAETLYHPTSTCAMGGDPESVCDPELRVRGVDGLRVVDASVMPAVPRGNTNAPTIALAERAADLIRS
jgi:choline dehydrogenase